ncbi:hypothetical protein GL270_09355 [Aeromonas veronii]|uniref:C80 family cysteine peptidase n=1 Tax=Aeromonas veronii TaxID=654 RepID=UPI001C5AC963|nr:C80 family cysteine peptidase [Aeromonas veronii]MBW3781452.1 hypothetical protein [Aeromonas veronii]
MNPDKFRALMKAQGHWRDSVQADPVNHSSSHFSNNVSVCLNEPAKGFWVNNDPPGLPIQKNDRKFDFNIIIRVQRVGLPNDIDSQLLAKRLFDKDVFKDKVVWLDWDPCGPPFNHIVRGGPERFPALGERVRLYFICHGNVSEKSDHFNLQPNNFKFNIINWSPGCEITGFHGGSPCEDMNMPGSVNIRSFVSAISQTKLFKLLGLPDKSEGLLKRRIGRVSIVACNMVDPDNYSGTGDVHHGFAKKFHKQLLQNNIETEVSARIGAVQIAQDGRKFIKEHNGASTPVKSKEGHGKVIFRGKQYLAETLSDESTAMDIVDEQIPMDWV